MSVLLNLSKIKGVFLYSNKEEFVNKVLSVLSIKAYWPYCSSLLLFLSFIFL